MSKEKKKSSHKEWPNAKLAELLQKMHNRAVWLSSTLRDLKLQFDTFRDETRLKLGKNQEFLNKIPEITTAAARVAFNDALVEMDYVGTRTYALDAFQATTKLKAEIDRAWALNESRNQVFRKFEEDVNRTLQLLNARLSKAESDLYFVKIANVDNARVVNSYGDRLKIAEGQTGMLSEVAVNNNGRLQVLEEKAESTGGLANAAWHQMVGVEKRVTRVEDALDVPSAVDQSVVDSKLSAVYYRITALEKRIREASVAAPATSQLWTTGNTSKPLPNDYVKTEQTVVSYQKS